MLGMKRMDDVKDLLCRYFPDSRIYLFGSRARGEESVYSDIDIAVENARSLKRELSLFREAIEASNVPYKVDIVELRSAPHLKQIIAKEGIRWH